MKKQLLLLVYVLCHVSYVFALDNFSLKLDSIKGTGWQAEKMRIQLQWVSDDQIAVTLKVALLTLPGIKKKLKNLELVCQHAQYNAEQITCPHARLHLGGDLLDKPNVNLSFTYHFNSQRILFSLTELALAEGNVTLRAESAPAGWQLQLDVNEVALEKLLAQLSTFIDLPSGLSLEGNTTLKIKLSGSNQLENMVIGGEVANLSFSNAEGTRAGENLAVQIAFEVTRQSPLNSERFEESEDQDGFQVQGTLTVNSGEVYIDPVYVDTEGKQVKMEVDLVWQPSHLTIHQLLYTHTDVGTLQGSGQLTLGDKWAIKTLSLKLMRTSLKSLYSHYLQTWLGSDSQWSQLEMTGEITAALGWDEENHHWMAQLENVDLDSSSKSWGFKGLRGKIQWHNKIPLPTHLHWSSAYFASQIQLGASQWRANLTGNRIKLLAPWYQPIFDGAIYIETFHLENLSQENRSWQLRGKLYPISLSFLSTALSGPSLNGQLSGEIPLLKYSDKYLNIGGKLQIHVFDGDIAVHTLSLDEPFGPQPVLKADVDVTKLNLQTLTKITEFGEIQGQLSGYVHDLRLVNWQPVSFDAHFATPEDDTMPHKISQQAINNLSNLGGGSSAVNAISQGILSIFENFSYQSIGWGCRLQSGICEMRGVEPAPKGYYIVKGGGLPRIDMIGHNPSVDWNVLINRLKRITNLSNISTPIIK